MAKYYGSIGYGETTEMSPGVWEEVITERKYFGDVLQFTSRWENGQGLNDDLNISNKISIVADPFAYEHFHNIRYAEWLGAKWKISNVEVAYPRLILSVGGVYNEESS